MDLCPMLTNRTIAAVEEKLPSSDETTAVRWAAIKSALTAKKDWLNPLLDEHWADVQATFDDCLAAVRTAHADDAEEYDRLRAELDDVEAEFKAMGLIAFP